MVCNRSIVCKGRLPSCPERLPAGTLLAGVVTVLGGAVLFDPKATSKAKLVAPTVFAASVAYLLNKFFDLAAPRWN